MKNNEENNNEILNIDSEVNHSKVLKGEVDLSADTQFANDNIDSKREKTKKFFNKVNFLQFVKFSAFSLSAGAIQLLSFELMYDVIGWKQWWATYLISIVLSVIWNFTFNRKFTFKSASNIPVAMGFAMLFYVFFIPVSVFGGQALESIGWNGTVVTVVMMLINFVLEYMWDKFLVFNDRVMNRIIKHKKAI